MRIPTLAHFPKRTVHVAVVDPGVGTRRRPIIAETKHSLFVGPDNGLLILAAEREGIKHVYAITNAEFMFRKISKTFHGRDVFAPAAAYLAKGRFPPEMGSEINDYVAPEFAKPMVKAKALIGQVLYIDDFGNIATNISTKDLNRTNFKEGDSLLARLDNKPLKLKLCSTYGDVGVNEFLAVIGSHEFLEISTNQGNAAKRLGAKPDMRIQITHK
jgi:S-adenosylmethionine hydrolase